MLRVYFDVFNVTSLLRNASSHGEATVAFGVRIGPGTYGHAGAQNYARGYNASALPLLFELHVESELRGAARRTTFASAGASPALAGGASSVVDGSPQPLVFHAHRDPILDSDWYTGETVDNTWSRSLDGWDSREYSTANGWEAAVEYTALAGRELTPTMLEPVTRHGPPLAPVKFISHGGGRYGA